MTVTAWITTEGSNALLGATTVGVVARLGGWGGPETGELRSATSGIQPLSDEQPLMATLVGCLGFTHWQPHQMILAILRSCSARVDGEDPERAAAVIAEEIWHVSGALLPDAPGHGVGLYVGGFGQDRKPAVYFIKILPGPGPCGLRRMIGPTGGIFVSDYAEAAAAAVRQVRAVPRTIPDAAELLRGIVQLEIDHLARQPSPRLNAIGPIHVMACERDRAPFAVPDHETVGS